MLVHNHDNVIVINGDVDLLASFFGLCHLPRVYFFKRGRRKVTHKILFGAFALEEHHAPLKNERQELHYRSS